MAANNGHSSSDGHNSFSSRSQLSTKDGRSFEIYRLDALAPASTSPGWHFLSRSSSSIPAGGDQQVGHLAELVDGPVQVTLPFPCSLATSTPQAFLVATPPAHLTGFRVAPTNNDKGVRCCPAYIHQVWSRFLT